MFLVLEMRCSRIPASPVHIIPESTVTVDSKRLPHCPTTNLKEPLHVGNSNCVYTRSPPSSQFPPSWFHYLVTHLVFDDPALHTVHQLMPCPTHSLGDSCRSDRVVITLGGSRKRTRNIVDSDICLVNITTISMAKVPRQRTAQNGAFSVNEPTCDVGRCQLALGNR
jgi:hypothetical protein